MIKHKTICPNCNVVEFEGKELYFSYETLVGFKVCGKMYVSENVWSKTTGKHLNMLVNKESRIPHAEFKKYVEEFFGD